MKLSKIVLTILVTLTFSTSVNADGPLNMKGFHHDMTFEEGCKILFNFVTPPEGETFQTDAKKPYIDEHFCGYAIPSSAEHNAWVETGPNISRKKNNSISFIYLDTDTIDKLFNVSTMDGEEFAQTFVDNYKWIDELDGKVFNNRVNYTQRNSIYGWEIIIYTKEYSTEKSIEIKFFESSHPSFD